MKKLNSFKQDILRLLKSVEPETLTFQGIKEQLASKHESRYKDGRVYGSALTYHLNWLLGKRLIRKNEETLLWGTPNADFKQKKSLVPWFGKRGLGFFGFLTNWLDRRAERKERKTLELRSRVAARMEIICSGKPFSWPKFEEALHKHRRKYDLE